MKVHFKLETAPFHCPHCGISLVVSQPLVPDTKTLLISTLEGRVSLTKFAYIKPDTLYIVDATDQPIRFDGRDAAGAIRCASCRHDLSYNPEFEMEDADAAIAKLQEARFAVSKAAELLKGVLAPECEAYAWILEANSLLQAAILESRPFALPIKTGS